MKLTALTRANGLLIRVSDIFAAPQLRELGARIRSNESKLQPMVHSPFSLCPDSPALLQNLRQDGLPEEEDVLDILPVTGQQMLFFDLWTITGFLFRINGPINVDRLCRACEAIIKRHGILRAIFTKTQRHEVVQVIFKQIQLPFHRKQTDDDLDETVSRPGQKVMALPSLSTTDFPLRFTLLSNSQDHHKHRFLIQISHSQMDGLSFPGLIQELSTADNCNISALPPAPSFTDFVHFVNQPQRRQAGLDFWSEYLRGLAITLPPITQPTSPSPPNTRVAVATSTKCQLPLPHKRRIGHPYITNSARTNHHIRSRNEHAREPRAEWFGGRLGSAFVSTRRGV